MCCLLTLVIIHPWPMAGLGVRASLSHLSNFRGPAQTLGRTVPAMVPSGAVLVMTWDGNPAGLRFLEAVQARDGVPAASRRLEFTAACATNGCLLAFRAVAADGDRAETVLLRGLDRIAFAYFGPRGLGQPDIWQPAWVDRDELPRLVRITVRFAAQDSRLWPPLDVALSARTDGTCEIDFLSGRCR